MKTFALIFESIQQKFPEDQQEDLVEKVLSAVAKKINKNQQRNNHPFIDTLKEVALYFGTLDETVKQSATAVEHLKLMKSFAEVTSDYKVVPSIIGINFHIKMRTDDRHFTLMFHS